MALIVRGAKLHLVDEGAGPPTLFLHGNPDSSEVWSGIIPHLGEHTRCLAPDLPGFGRSTVPAGFDFSLDGLAGFIDELVQAIGIKEPLNLVVHDIGGPYGLSWAAKHPKKVRSLVIMNTVFSSDFEWHSMAKIWRTPILGELMQMLTNRRAFVRELRRGSRKLSLEQINRTYDLMTPEMKRMVLRLYRAIDIKDFRGRENALRNLAASVPSLVLWGDHDPYVPARFAETFGAQKVEHFPDCGHWLPLEAGREIAERLRTFLAEESDHAQRNDTNTSAQVLRAV